MIVNHMDVRDGKWRKDISLTQRTNNTFSFLLENKFVDKNVELSISANSATPSFDGGELVNTNATATFTNATASTNDTSGIAVQTKGSAGVGAVTYDGAVNGWVNVNDDSVAKSAVSSNQWNGDIYYLTGVTLGNGKSFDITVPNGSSGTVTFHFSVDANGNTTIS